MNLRHLKEQLMLYQLHHPSATKEIELLKKQIEGIEREKRKSFA